MVDLPRLPWWLLLNLVILPLRPRRSARLYRTIWTDEGSPLLATTRRLAASLGTELHHRTGRDIPVGVGMRYGNPSVADALANLTARGCRRLLVLPLFPQYSATTTASALDAVAAALRLRRDLPSLRFVSSYADHAAYIDALAESVRTAWRNAPPGERLLVSFHGLPQRYADEGDPYPAECEATAEALADRLELSRDRWMISYQSRFGRDPWLEPATDEVLSELGRRGVRAVDVICPGFAVDCLETLEEIALTGAEQFRKAGGGTLRYVPALNDAPAHATALAEIAVGEMQGWLD